MPKPNKFAIFNKANTEIPIKDNMLVIESGKFTLKINGKYLKIPITGPITLNYGDEFKFEYGFCFYEKGIIVFKEEGTK